MSVVGDEIYVVVGGWGESVEREAARVAVAQGAGTRSITGRSPFILVVAGKRVFVPSECFVGVANLGRCDGSCRWHGNGGNHQVVDVYPAVAVGGTCTQGQPCGVASRQLHAVVLTVLIVLKGGESDKGVPVCGVGQVTDVNPGAGVVVGVAGRNFVEQLDVFPADCVASGKWWEEHHFIAIRRVVVWGAVQASARHLWISGLICMFYAPSRWQGTAYGVKVFAIG